MSNNLDVTTTTTAQSNDGAAKMVSLVIPCLNEENTLRDVIERAKLALATYEYDGEVIVADNGSIDRSREIAVECGARLVPVPLRGYGSAIGGGIEAARGQFIITADADCSYDFMEADRFVSKWREGYDFVMGTRLKGTIDAGAMPGLHRYVGTPVLTFLIDFFFGTRISDCNCGMRGFSKEAFDRLEVHSTGMEFASETIIKAGLLKLPMAEVPVTLHVDRRGKPPHLNPWLDGWRHLRFILTYASDRILFFPGLIMCLVGIAGFGLLLPGPLRIQGFFMDFHYLFPSAMLVILGTEFMMLTFLIKTYTGLAKYNAGLRIFLERFRFEHLMIVGLLLTLCGLVVDVSIVIDWVKSAGRGLFAVRPAILALTLVAMGFEIFSTCFFMSVLTIPQRRLVQ